MNLRIALSCALAASLFASAASAQTYNGSELLETQAVHTTSIWSTATSETPGHLKPAAGLTLHFADDPVVLRNADGDDIARLVDSQLKLDLGLGIGVWDWLEFGLVVPFVAYQTGESVAGFPEADTVALGDLRAHARARVLRAGGWGVAGYLTSSIPIADSAYQSSNGVGLMPGVIVDYTYDGSLPWTVAGNLGWNLRPETGDAFLETDDSLDWRVGTEVGIAPDQLHLLASLYGRWEPISEAERTFSAEGLVGARFFFGRSGWSSSAGLGAGLTGGYGAADFRALLSIGYTPAEEEVDGEPKDSDGDGLLDRDDDCPDEPEDKDSFEDEDGCPDPDNDGDGVLDVDDKCPNTAGLAEAEGCQPGDRDGDGIDDLTDSCPDEPEDKDGFEDEDGCADNDNDRDGVLDPDDKCPTEKEVINGFEDEDGCPDEGETKVQVTRDRIVILDKVYFDTSKAVIKERSFDVLQQVASVMKANPQIKKLSIEGHTDSRGDDDDNMQLSQRRAEAVREFLINKGIAADRLVAKGFGETKPVATNDTKDGRAQNRRVEFLIAERGEQ